MRRLLDNRPCFDESVFFADALDPAFEQFLFQIGKLFFFELFLGDLLDDIVAAGFRDAEPNQILHDKLLIDHAVLAFYQDIVKLRNSGRIRFAVYKVLEQACASWANNGDKGGHF